jgi:multicomponent Na+:H+ antiporter subunit D
MDPVTAMIAALILPLVAALLVALIGERAPDARDGSMVVVAILTFGVVCTLLGSFDPAVGFQAVGGSAIGFDVVEVLPGLTLGFSLEPLGMLFSMVASGLWILTTIYAIGYMRGHAESNQTRFFACFGLAIFGALGVAWARNMFTFFIFYEVLTLSTYPLVTHSGTEEARRAGRVYLGILFFTSICLLLWGTIWVWQIAGTLEFVKGGVLAEPLARGDLDPALLPVLVGLFMFGTGKAALMPFHRWLPNAMVAPTPVSALLHAVAVVKAGVFTILKVTVYLFGVDLLARTGASHWVGYVAAFTIIASSIVALRLDNLKARLAYSTISQLSYIVLGASLATAAGVVGGGMHIAMHAVGKITLFFCAGAIMVGAHKTEISTMDGLGHKMPVTMFAFFLGSVCIIGLPPMGGAWSKWFLALGAAQGGQLFLVATLMASSLFSIGYLMPIVGRAFFVPAPVDHHGDHHASDGHGDGHGEHHGEVHRFSFDLAPSFCLVPLTLTGLGCLVLFFLAEPIQALLLPIVAS